MKKNTFLTVFVWGVIALIVYELFVNSGSLQAAISKIIPLGPTTPTPTVPATGQPGSWVATPTANTAPIYTSASGTYSVDQLASNLSPGSL